MLNNKTWQYKTSAYEDKCWTYSAVPLQRGQLSHKYSQKTPHSSPVRVRYEVSFVDPASDWYSVSFPVIIYVKCYNIGQRYNSTWL